mgnify:CR=1 FL=1
MKFLIQINTHKKLLFLYFTLLCFKNMNAQDSITLYSEVDTTIVRTIVIRADQEKIKNIPRSAKLTNPVISFKKTKVQTKLFKGFKIPSFWTKENKISLKLSEVAFVNWNAGGNNSVSTIGNARFVRNYKFRHIQWANDLELRYGLNTQEGRALRKTDDAIRISSTFGYRRDTISNWYYSVKANFNTQFSNGYKYPNREVPISRFMAPGYFFLGAGTSYISKGGSFDLYLSPVTQKMTYVGDQNLANKGIFGVKKAIFDTDGSIIKKGENIYMELGFLITNNWETMVYENVKLNHRISFYSDYLNNFGNIDLDWELKLDLKVNNYVSASIGTHVIFDDDILFDEEKATDGTITKAGIPRIQFKQILGVGLAYDF